MGIKNYAHLRFAPTINSKEKREKKTTQKAEKKEKKKADLTGAE